jgi:hypothetical protein
MDWYFAPIEARVEALQRWAHWIEKTIEGPEERIEAAAIVALEAFNLGSNAEAIVAAAQNAALAWDAQIMRGVKLCIQDEQEVLNPKAKQIDEAIRSMTPGDSSFVILQKSADDLTYIQALRTDNLWAVEYQDGDLEHHFLASGKFSTQQVIALFLAYATGHDTWRTSVSWEPWDVK